MMFHFFDCGLLGLRYASYFYGAVVFVRAIEIEFAVVVKIIA